ncbi:hypothetical protein SAY87_005406 [Trapa incisa]|uniref:Bifunctional inhibitor/plant lipid transfer protein/seed storage helical domain-containing protein n=1 Tax=Trapa incisa TaxID=236973 RepID=A0AAN7K2V3_9MYRT|nr:hypothetical protein SAY87_005406 [Trapa incisa]
MALRRAMIGGLQLSLAASALVVVLTMGPAAGDMNQDRAECANQLAELSTCLTYVGGDAKAPTNDCCKGLKQVIEKSSKCICILVKDRDDPSLQNLKINATLALGLPDKCQFPTNVTECINLLHLDPKSPEAKIFQGSLSGNSSSTPSASTITAPSVANVNSGGNGTASGQPNGSSGNNKMNMGSVLVLVITCVAALWMFTSDPTISRRHY